MSMDQQKRCRKCHKWVSIDSYYVKPDGGLYVNCMECCNKIKRCVIPTCPAIIKDDETYCRDHDPRLVILETHKICIYCKKIKHKDEYGDGKAICVPCYSDPGGIRTR